MPHIDESPSLDKAPRTEVHKAFVSLTWQNLFMLIAFVGTAAGLYWHMDARIAAQERAIDEIVEVQRFESDWLDSIAVKTGVSPPVRERDR